MATWVWVAVGGAAGAILRYCTTLLVGGSLLVAGDIGLRFPWATLLINLIGCFAIGAVWGFSSNAPWFDAWGRAFLLIGVLGGFTTFSTFALECLRLFEHDRLFAGTAYAVVSVVGCLLVVWLGRSLGHYFGQGGVAVS